MTVQETDARFMEEALELAEQGRYTASPNPCVGCLVVADGTVVGRGFHRRTGELHAEPQALTEAGDRARGATMYVTLEPCAHQGRTAPCVSEIIAAGIKRVVSACEDPNPQVAGRGHGMLKEAGIECEVGIGAERTQALNRGFWKRMTIGRPWVCVKQAMSLDGGTALADGHSQWITSLEARADVQWRRARSGAVLSTAATVGRDDARLNVRLKAQVLGVDQVRQPLRVIMDRKGELSSDLSLWSVPGSCVVYTLDEHAEKLRAAIPSEAEIQTVQAGGKGLDLAAVLSGLATDYEINDILVEAGAKFVGALIQEDLVDEMVIYIAPRLLGADAAPLAELPPAEDLPERLGWMLQDVRALGPDVRITYHRSH
ncbi:MAG: bifunctional diaminohydroxyphosphoribosylaminopyrimidine deaminase/5-amino-6-(5-phosphoribosylamino)uracil reductase RibD [Gammaproteobacteria bacterium]|nr:bifunctional diaminohydroxyphosphoribosylaminopyrimidine deaminase/5-amino-6-(5-phosphoribosylamino)uracil reductase RibD [Gammaproteobacteria bacterium]